MHRSLALLALLISCGTDNKVGSFNTAPSVSITSPPDGQVYDEGSSITFQAIADDDFDASPALTITWPLNLSLLRLRSKFDAWRGRGMPA